MTSDTPILPSNSKRARKERIPFSPALLTQGTVCEMDIPFNENSIQTVRLTVEKLVKYSPQEYMVHFAQQGQPLMVRMRDITRIVEHKTGSMKVDRSSELDRARNFFKKLDEEEDFGKAKKHPTQYRTVFIENLLEALVARYKRDDQMFDSGKLNQLIEDMNIFKVVDTGGFWGYPVYCINKKKLHAAIKRVFNKCLVKQATAQKALDSVFNGEWKWDVNLEDFTRENVHVIETGENEIKLNVPQP
jgi:hypothetical protein